MSATEAKAKLMEQAKPMADKVGLDLSKLFEKWDDVKTIVLLLLNIFGPKVMKGPNFENDEGEFCEVACLHEALHHQLKAVEITICHLEQCQDKPCIFV